MRTVLLVVLAIFPNAIKQVIYRRGFGFQIGRGVKLGFSIVLAWQVKIGDGSRLGNFNVIKKLPLFEMGPRSSIGSFNYFAHGTHPAQAKASFALGSDSAITGGHYFDVAAPIRIGDFTTVAGKGSQFWTHGIDVVRCVQSVAPISIGSYVLVCAGAKVVGGAIVPDKSVVAAGAVVAAKYCEAGVLLAGVPATVRKKFSTQEAYFQRTAKDVYWG
ncbi:hypothetical protein K0B96_09245 [Horticoccus luteus]|uniref:Acyltransferase n=1 Tax=Horticoccus luteus TaxID=2862869 RepID=A0A8F9XFV3_9BACT|nr:hypothetical protein [Horticoccus luteus]QYM77515.1 hypothetical protein K0B96_09245 [Horticoccus luteus]